MSESSIGHVFKNCDSLWWQRNSTLFKGNTRLRKMYSNIGETQIYSRADGKKKKGHIKVRDRKER